MNEQMVIISTEKLLSTIGVKHDYWFFDDMGFVQVLKNRKIIMTVSYELIENLFMNKDNTNNQNSREEKINEIFQGYESLRNDPVFGAKVVQYQNKMKKHGVNEWHDFEKIDTNDFNVLYFEFKKLMKEAGEHNAKKTE